MNLLRWKVKTLMVMTLAIAGVLALSIEMRKRSIGRFVAFHDAGARELREAMRTSEIAAVECERRAALGVPSETNKWLLYDNPTRMLSPEEWAHWSKVFRGNVDMFRKMAEQREAIKACYMNNMIRPWKSLPPDVFKEQVEAQYRPTQP